MDSSTVPRVRGKEGHDLVLTPRLERLSYARVWVLLGRNVLHSIHIPARVPEECLYVAFVISSLTRRECKL